jgi:DNA-directed RNA polymerase specialized sigma24 family protein
VREQCRSDSKMFSAIERLNLKRAISKLPPGYKRQFLLSDVLGYEHSEVALTLGMLNRLFKVAASQGT